MRRMIALIVGVIMVLALSSGVVANGNGFRGLRGLWHFLRGLEKRVAMLETNNDALQARVEELEQLGEVSSAVVEDATGRVVGIVLDQIFPEREPTPVTTVLLVAAVLMEIDGIPAIVQVTPTKIGGFSPGFGNNERLNFDGEGCTGTAFVFGTSSTTFGGLALEWKGNLHIPTPEPGMFRTLESRVSQNAEGNFCEDDTFETTYTEAITVPLTIFDGFTPPFSISGLPSLSSP